MQTSSFWSTIAISGTTPEQRALALQQKQFDAQMRPLRDAVANLLLDAWVADHARKVKLEASEEQRAMTREAKQACQLALELNRPELIAPLLDTNIPMDINELLVYAIMEEQLGAVKTFVQRGAPLEHPTNGTDSALGWACIVGKDSPGKLAIVRFLLEKGADVNHLDNYHHSILRDAVSYGPDTVGLLLAYGAKVNVQDSSGNTALIVAAANGEEASVKMLLAHGADPNLRTAKGETALSEAIQNKHVGAARLLEQAGARP